MAKNSKKAEKKDTTALVALAESMNDIMGLDPAIDTDADYDALLAEIQENMTEIDVENDTFDESVLETLEVVAGFTGFADAREAEEKKAAAKKTVKKAAPAKTTPAKAVEKDKQAPAAKSAPADKKATAKTTPAKKAPVSDLLEYAASLIKKGTMTKKDIVDNILAKYPERKVSTVQTLLSDGKNPKYNRFPKLVIQKDDGVLLFAK